MKKLTSILPFFIIVINTSAQNTGLGTTNPNATLEIAAQSPAAPSNQDGILIPRINVFPAFNPGNNQNGMMVYLTTASGNNKPGFYYWDNGSFNWKGIADNRYWSLTGNAATNPATNFIGTTDDNDFFIKRFNIQSALLNKSNTSWGVGALNPATTGKFNTANGDSSLLNNSTGSGNTGAGYFSLYNNITGDQNTASGFYALTANTTATGNTAFGTKSLYSNTTGNTNTAGGAFSLFQNIDGGSNTALGFQSLFFNSSASFNTALGVGSLYHNVLGYSNTAAGYQSLYSNQTGSNNVAYGDSALYRNTTGDANTGNGAFALYTNTTGSQNTATGYNALRGNTSATGNTADGVKALYTNTIGANNTAGGAFSLFQNIDGGSNTAVGFQSLFFNSSASFNTAFGVGTLYNNHLGSNNTGVGFEAGRSADNSYGTYIGYQAGRNTNGVSNTYLGWGAGTDASLFSITTGSNNVCVGVRAGQGITTGDQNIIIGNLSSLSPGTLTNTITVGFNATNTQSNSVVLGNGSISKWGFGTNTTAANILEFNNAVTTASLTTGGVWTNASDRSVKTNFTELNKVEILDRILQLPITRWNYISEDANNTHIGPVAQDFYRLFNTGNNDKTISTIDPAGVALIGVQELKAEIELLKAQNKLMMKEIKRLKKKK